VSRFHTKTGPFAWPVLFCSAGRQRRGRQQTGRGPQAEFALLGKTWHPIDDLAGRQNFPAYL